MNIAFSNEFGGQINNNSTEFFSFLWSFMKIFIPFIMETHRIGSRRLIFAYPSTKGSTMDCRRLTCYQTHDGIVTAHFQVGNKRQSTWVTMILVIHERLFVAVVTTLWTSSIWSSCSHRDRQYHNS